MGTEPSWEQRRFDRFNELLAELWDVDDFENSPRRLYVETPGGQIPRRLSKATVGRITAQLNRELPGRRQSPLEYDREQLAKIIASGKRRDT